MGEGVWAVGPTHRWRSPCQRTASTRSHIVSAQCLELFGANLPCCRAFQAPSLPGPCSTRFRVASARRFRAPFRSSWPCDGFPVVTTFLWEPPEPAIRRRKRLRLSRASQRQSHGAEGVVRGEGPRGPWQQVQITCEGLRRKYSSNRLLP